MLIETDTPEPNGGAHFLATTRAHWIILLLAASSYVILFALYYPPICGIEDEIGFVNQAVVWSKGAISAEGAGLTAESAVLIGVQDFREGNGVHVPWRNVGRSLIVFPLVLFLGIHSIFISGAVIQLALTAVAALIHVRLGQSPLWAALVLCHPTLSVYSRTIMGDAPAGLFLLVAVWLILVRKDPGLGAGICIGIATAMRYHVILTLPIFSVILWHNHSLPHAKREALKCFVAGAMIAAAIGSYNFVLFGSPLGWRGQGYFDTAFFWQHFLFFAGNLLIIWPGLFLAPFFDKSAVAAYARALCGSVFLLFCFYYYYDRGSSWAETTVLAQRYLQCVLPIWIVSYSSVLNQRVLPFLRRSWGGGWVGAFGALALTGLLVGQTIVFYKHQQHLHVLETVRDEIITKVPVESTIVSNSTVLKLFGIEDASHPKYHWVIYGPNIDLDYRRRVLPTGQPWFLALLPKKANDERTAGVEGYVREYGLTHVHTTAPGLMLYASSTQERRTDEGVVPAKSDSVAATSR